MQDQYLLVLLGAEALLIVLFVYLLIHKSKQLTDLFEGISKLKRAGEELHKRQKKQDDLMPMLVHELRSPLSIIKGSSDLIIREASSLSMADIEKLLGQIRSSSSGLLKLVNDILDTSKMESGIFEIHKEKLDINHLLEEERDYYKAKAIERNIKFDLHLDPSLPKVSFDTDRIKQVMNNLLSNALKFTPEGGSVSIRSMMNPTDKNSIRISVEDSGSGVPDEVKPKLFHKFVQLENNTTEEKGTGLGLVICKGIIKAHGGTIWVEDNQPQGARFVFTLPV